MTRLIVKSAAEQQPRFIELKPGMNRIGRGGLSDHLIDDPSISEQHCEIVVGDDVVTVRDLHSTNGTFIDSRPITESALHSGQVLQIGPLELELEAPPPRVVIPELPKIEPPPEVVSSVMLADGYPACLSHEARHGAWECTHCGRIHCDECVRRLRRVGGEFVRLCPACSNICKLSAWSEMVKRRKRSMLRKLAESVTSTFKRTAKIFPIRAKKKTVESAKAQARH